MIELVRDLEVAIARVSAAARREIDLSQEEVAAALGMSGNRYAKIERGQGLPSLETLARLARVLDVRPSELLGVSDRSPRPSVAQGKGVARRRLQRLEAMVRRASPETIRLVTLLIAELERAARGA